MGSKKLYLKSEIGKLMRAVTINYELFALAKTVIHLQLPGYM